MHALLADVRSGLRSLLRSPGFTAAAVVALALGIGANTAIFSVVSSVLLRPLPYRDPDRLVRIWESNPGLGWPQFSTSYLNFLDWKRETRSFEPLAAWRNVGFNLTGSGEPERVGGGAVTASLFPMLGIDPALGRSFTTDEERPGGPRVVLMTDGLWKRRFGSDPAVVGSTLVLNDIPRTVVGVLPPELSWFPGADLFVPLDLTADPNRGNHVLSAFGRLKEGISLAQAKADLDQVARHLEQEHPESNGGWGVRIATFYDWIVDARFRRALLVLLGAVGLVLLIACANVASLLLARASDRKREIALRVALGAGRLGIVRQFLVETGLVCVLGGCAGLALGVWGLDLLRAIDPGNIPRFDEVGLDPRAVLYTLALTLAATVLSGLAPALEASRTDMGEALKEGGRGPSLGGRNRFRGVIVAFQFGLCLVLLVGAGLLTRSYWRLQGVDPGFARDHLLAVQINLPQARYPNDADGVAFYRSLLERVAAVPGVRSAALGSSLPFEGGNTANEVTIEGKPPGSIGSSPSADWRIASPGYFRTLLIPLRSGREFTEQDGGPGTPGVIIVSETMARRFWPGEDPLGKRLKPGRSPLWQTVIDVAADARHTQLDAELRPMMYFPYEGSWNPMSLAVRTAGEPASMAPTVRAVVRSLDPRLPLATARTLDVLVAESVGPRRFPMALLVVFAGMALALASLGLYGVTSYSVARRTHEIGVRMALGARPADVVRMIVGQGARLILAGLLAGLLSALALGKVLSGLLFGVGPRDPLTLVGVSVLLTGVALLAAYLPARRAVRIDPMIALRCE